MLDPVAGTKDGHPTFRKISFNPCISSPSPVEPSLQGSASVNEIQSGIFQLQNADFTLVVQGGAITSIYDIKSQREVIPSGSKANQMVIFDDKPLYWQAWDVEVYHLASRQELAPGKTTIQHDSPLKVSVVTEQKISDESWIKTTISLAAAIEGHPSYIEMESEVEWRESMKFLKVEFPVDVRNTEASYETQFGIVRRPTHYNTRYVLTITLTLCWPPPTCYSSSPGD
jgi:alpha-mannosidase